MTRRSICQHRGDVTAKVMSPCGRKVIVFACAERQCECVRMPQEVTWSFEARCMTREMKREKGASKRYRQSVAVCQNCDVYKSAD